MKTISFALVVLLSFPASGWAASGDAVLASVDTAMNRASTLSVEWEVSNQEPDKTAKKLGLLVRSKGEKELWEFTSPADMKGTKVLKLAADRNYVYLPAFGKVRRVASSAGEQGFMGMAFSLNDHTARFSELYTASQSSGGKLVLTAKEGLTTPYARIEMTVSADDVPTELKYFDVAGTNIKTETRRYACDKVACTPTERKMVDNVRKSSTTMTRKSVKVDDPMSDDLFSVRALEQ
jgi:outer membrane lipoprotein-sorting protein